MDLQFQLVEEICELTYGLQTDELDEKWKAPRGVSLLEDGTGAAPFQIEVKQLAEVTANRLIGTLRRVLRKFLKDIVAPARANLPNDTEWRNIHKQTKSLLKSLKGKTFQDLTTKARIEKLKRLQFAIWH